MRPTLMALRYTPVKGLVSFLSAGVETGRPVSSDGGSYGFI